MSEVYVSRHPLVQHKLSLLRRTVTEPKKFRELVRELAQLLLYEATLDLPLQSLEIQTPLAPLVASEIGVRIGLVPILRASLGMVDPILELIPMRASGTWGSTATTPRSSQSPTTTSCRPNPIPTSV